MKRDPFQRGSGNHGGLQINYGGKTGYVSSEYVQVDGNHYGETVEQKRSVPAEVKEAAAQKQKERQRRRKREANKAALAADDSVLWRRSFSEAGEEPYEGQVAVGGRDEFNSVR